MSDAAPGQSMEEILASIKRVITRDADAVAPRFEEEDVLELGPPSAPPEPLVSEAARAASRQALATLSGLRIDPAAGADTLDGLVREMLRPMLKAWLDANLPDLVERVVAREVARVIGR